MKERTDVKKKTTYLMTAILILGTVICGCGGIKARSIAIKELNGTAHVTNADSFVDAYTGQALVSGDNVNTDPGSDMTLLLDSDKHIYVYESTRFTLYAEGGKNSTKTRIVLDEGLLINGIDEPLGADESYEVTTPNATMSVRGTVFKTSVSYDTGAPVTSLEVLEGSVEGTTVKDGKTETVTVTSGNSMEFTGVSPDGSGETNASQTEGEADSVQTETAATTETAYTTDIDESVLSQEPVNNGYSGIYGVYRNGDMVFIIAPGVHHYQITYSNGGGLHDRGDADPGEGWYIYDYGYGEGIDRLYFGSNVTIDGNTLTDYTERELNGPHVADITLTAQGNGLKFLRIVEGETYDDMILEKTDEDPVALYNEYVSRFPVVSGLMN